MMAWENTLLASRVLPPSYVPSDSSANNRTIDASMVLDQDGRLTLLIILTTAAGLAIVLLFFLLLRIGCLRKKTCFWRSKEHEHHKRKGDRSPSYLASVVTNANGNERRCSAKSSAAASQETLQTRSEHDRASNYTIKLIDNDLIIETQQSHQDAASGALGALESVAAGLPYADGSVGSVTNVDGAAAGQNGAQQLFKSWLLTLKNKEWDSASQSFQMTPLETKSLCGSPGRCRRTPIPSDRQERLANQKQQILARFGQHLPGFGFTRSGSSIDASSASRARLHHGDGSAQSVSSPVRYSYTYGNQMEYMGGPYGYVDPVFSHHFRSTTAIGPRSVLDCAPSMARSAESLLVIANPIPYPIVSNQP